MGTPQSREVLQETFLAAFVHAPVIARAAKIAKLNRLTVFHWLRNDPAFVARFEQAKIDAAEFFEDRARSMARSDPDMTRFVLKALKPERYRENIKIDHAGEVTIKRVVLGDDE